MAVFENLNSLNPRALFEEVAYAFSIIVFALSSLFLGLDILFSSLAVLSFVIGFFFRGWPISLAALAAYCAAIAVSSPPLNLLNLLIFGLFSLLPFFSCFRASLAKSVGFIPVEPAAALIPVFIAAALFLLNTGFFFSSTDSLLPQGVFIASILSLLALMLVVPILAETWGRLTKAPVQSP